MQLSSARTLIAIDPLQMGSSPLENDRLPRGFIHAGLSRRELMALTDLRPKVLWRVLMAVRYFIPPSSTRAMLASRPHSVHTKAVSIPSLRCSPSVTS